jgi:hypothetical protein
MTDWIVYYVRFDVFTAMTMKNIVFCDVAPCGSGLNRRFREVSPALKMEVIRSSITLVQTSATQSYFPEDDFLPGLYIIS